MSKGVKVLKPGRDYKLNLPKDHLSVSQIETYLRCPRQYAYDYVEGRPRKLSLPLLEGGAMAKGLACIHRREGLSKAIDAVEGELEARWPEMVPQEDTMGVVLDRSKRFLSAYSSNGVPDPYVRRHKRKVRDGVEEEFLLKIAGVPVLGYIDLVEEHRVTDFKVAKTVNFYDAYRSVQLSMYALATGIPNVRYYVFLKGQNKMRELSATLDLKKVKKWLDLLVSQIAHGISMGVFPVCNPSSNKLCCPAFCSHWDSCYGRFFSE